MVLTELKITEFIELLGSDTPAPGGGSASALMGSLGISLLKMVSELTVSRKKYEEHHELMEEIIKEANIEIDNFIKLIDEDTQAYNGVTAVFKMPKDTEEEKEIRGKALQEALENSTKTPLKMMETSVRALEIVKKALGKTNTNCASDLGVGAVALKSAIQGAWLNVKINTPGLKNEEFASECEKRGEELLSIALPLADEIYEYVLNNL